MNYKGKGSTFSINVIANILARIWSMASIYIFIPVYISFLGKEAYGLVTFFATLYSVMNLLGLGLSNTLRREFASGEDSIKNRLHKYQMLRSVEVVYWIIGILITLICFFGAEFIARYWLNIGVLEFNTVVTTIRLMGGSIALQILAQMYSGCLFGLNYQVKANIYQSSWSAVKNLGVVAVLWIVAKDIRLFYTWHVIADLLYVLILRHSAVMLVKDKESFKWSIANLSNLKLIWKFAMGLFLVSIVYALNTQLDKVVISKYLSLTELGAYNISYSLGSLTSIVATAVGTAAFSKFTEHFTTGNIEKQKESFVIYNRLAGITVVAVGAFVAVYSYELLLIWTRNIEISQLAKQSAFLVVLGSAFSSLQILPYQFMLSRGNTKVNNILGISSIPYIIIVTPFLVKRLGIYGASISWCFYMLVSSAIYLYYIHNKYIGKDTLRWLFSDVFLPFIFSLVMAFGSKYIFYRLGLSQLEIVALSVVSGFICVMIMLFLFDKTMYRYFKVKFGKFNH